MGCVVDAMCRKPVSHKRWGAIHESQIHEAAKSTMSCGHAVLGYQASYVAFQLEKCKGQLN
jgi:hypothetical protein